MRARADEPAFVADKRAAKAATLAGHLSDLGATATDVVRFTEQDRRAAERSAQTRKASAATWSLTASMLAGSRQASAACPTCRIGDPQGIDVPPRPFNHDGPCSTGRLSA